MVAKKSSDNSWAWTAWAQSSDYHRVANLKKRKEKKGNILGRVEFHQVRRFFRGLFAEFSPSPWDSGPSRRMMENDAVHNWLNQPNNVKCIRPIRLTPKRRNNYFKKLQHTAKNLCLSVCLWKVLIQQWCNRRLICSWISPDWCLNAGRALGKNTMWT